MVKNICLNIMGMLLLMAGIVNGQVAEHESEYPKEVTIQSWKKGAETVKNQQIKIVLSSTNKDYQQEIVGDSGKRYKLIVYHNPYTDQELEHWEIQLYEILSKKQDVKEVLSSTLFSLEPNESGKHYFPREELIGILFPREKPFAYSENGEPIYGEGYNFYYIKTARKIKIENFCVVIKVGDYKFNQIDNAKLDSLEVFIEFTSACKDDLTSEKKKC